MGSLHVRYLLVGGGLASSEAAAAIRSLDREGDLLLVGQEINRPYRRPPLSKEFLRGRQGHEQLFTQTAEWFADHRVQLRTGRRVSRLDTSRNLVALDNGEEISFDQMLIAIGANGAAPLRKPGAELPNLYYLRTLEEAERLVHAMDKARREGRVVKESRGRATVIGGGLLGVELAGALREKGLHVDLALAGEGPWESFAGPATGKCVSRFLEQNGIVVHANGPAVRLEGDGRVQRVVLASGESIDCDFAIAAVGMEMNRELLRGTPIAAEKAILVDERCQSSLPNVYAAGDCAAVRDPLFHKHRVIPHWETAAAMGRIAGTNMAGGKARFDLVSHFDSEVLGLHIDVWGEAKAVDHRIIRGTASAESPQFVEIGVASDGRVAQVVAVGKHEPIALRDLVRDRVRVNGREEALKDPAIPIDQALAGG